MQPLNAEIAEVLQTASRIPRVYAMFQLPVIVSSTDNTIDYKKLGAQLVLDNIQSARITTIFEPGSNSLDLTFINPATNMYSSISSSPAPLGKFFFPGAVDNKIQLYAGIVNVDGTTTLYPKGIYVSEAFNQDVSEGTNTVTINALDQYIMFQQNVYGTFPPVLYGKQTSSYYTSAYALQNPSGDLTTYVCDAVNWMTETSQASAFANNFLPVTVYVGTSTNPSNTPYTGTFTINYVQGSITFASKLCQVVVSYLWTQLPYQWHQN